MHNATILQMFKGNLLTPCTLKESALATFFHTSEEVYQRKRKKCYDLKRLLILVVIFTVLHIMGLKINISCHYQYPTYFMPY